jgi:hypothetical protein
MGELLLALLGIGAKVVAIIVTVWVFGYVFASGALAAFKSYMLEKD